jgi:hypothetical protein
MGLFGGTGKPVMLATSREVRTSCVGSIPVRSLCSGKRVASAMTTSSSAQLPARSPMPLIVTSA